MEKHAADFDYCDRGRRRCVSPSSSVASAATPGRDRRDGRTKTTYCSPLPRAHPRSRRRLRSKLSRLRLIVCDLSNLLPASFHSRAVATDTTESDISSGYLLKLCGRLTHQPRTPFKDLHGDCRGCMRTTEAVPGKSIHTNPVDDRDPQDLGTRGRTE